VGEVFRRDGCSPAVPCPAGVLEDAVVRAGVAGEFVGIGGEEKADVEIAIDQMAGDDGAVAAVVAFAGDDDDRARNSEGEDEFGGVATGVFHEEDAGDAVVTESADVNVTDLGACEG